MAPCIEIDNYGLAFSDEDPVGDDPRYLDEFDLIRTEIEKISGCDFNLIETRARFILLEKSKDLRVGGYLILALSYLKGVSGLIEGLSIYNEMLASFGASIHPLRPLAKASAIKWLNNHKLEAFIKKETLTDEKIFLTLSALIKRLNQLIDSAFPEIETRFFILNSWLSSQKIDKESLKEKSAAFIQKILPSTQNKQNKQNSYDTFIIEDQKSYESTCKNLLSYFKTNQKRAEQITISRMLRWPNELKMPAHDHDNKTLLPPMRKEGLTEINQLLEGGDQALLFNKIENAFLDIGGHYYLDLQYHAYCALKQLSDHVAIEQLTFHLSTFIKNNPSISSLKFNDNTPFASTTTKHWLNELMKAPKEQAPIPTQNENFKTHIDFIHQAKQLSDSIALSSELTALKKIPAHSPRESIAKSFAIAQLLSASKTDLACFQYQALCEEIKEKHLDHWLPEVAIEILSAYKKLLITLRQTEDEIRVITQWLCRLDPVACL